MNKVIQHDLFRIGIADSHSKKRLIKKILHSYSFHVLYFYRLHQKYCAKSGSGMGCRIVIFLKSLFERLYDIHIDLSAQISGGLYIGHFGGIHIGYCSIGENCNINQQVRIGAPYAADEGDRVVIGNRVWIGAHSRILPGVKIGDSVTVSAGAVVNRDIPSFCLVSGERCRVVNNHYDNSHLLKINNQP